MIKTLPFGTFEFLSFDIVSNFVFRASKLHFLRVQVVNIFWEETQ